MFETHKDQGKERWEIYAWAMHQIMLEHGKLTKSTIPFKVKDVYVSYMNQSKGAIHPDELNEETAPVELLKSQKSMTFIREANIFKRSNSLTTEDKENNLISISQKTLFKSQV